MPELPDIKVYAMNLEKKFLHKKIVEVVVYNPNKINVDKEIFIKCVKDNKFCSIEQDGKELKFLLSDGTTIGVHLMLMGKLVSIDNKDKSTVRNKIISVVFEDNNTLNVCDEQMFCKIELNPQKKQAPDALSSEFTKEYFIACTSASPRKNVKAFLLDQKKMRGIGNAYADEILYSANISPNSKVGKIPHEVQLVLYEQIRITLNWGIENILKATPHAINGELRDFLNVHNANISITKKGEKIIVEKIASKKTYYTLEQKTYQ